MIFQVLNFQLDSSRGPILQLLRLPSTSFNMPFHGYGLAYCNLASCPILDCPDDHDTPLQQSYKWSLPRAVGPASNSPVDLSKYCTGTTRGTWSVGGGRTTTKPQPQVQVQNSTGQHGVTFSSQHSPPSEAFTSKAENMCPVAQTQSIRSAAAEISNGLTDTAAENLNTEREEIERIKYEKRQVALLEKVRATGFPLPIRSGENQMIKASSESMPPDIPHRRPREIGRVV